MMRFGNESQSVDIRADARGDHARLVPAGPFDLPHAAAVARAVDDMPPRLQAYKSIDVDLGHLDEIDGAGAVLLARLFDRLDASGRRTQIVDSTNPEAARLIALYRRHDERRPSGPTHAASMLARIGAVTGEIPDTFNAALDFTGYCASALPKVAVSPRSVDWRSLPRLLQEIGADGFVVTGAANLLVGLIIGLLGVSQLARFGAVAYVPELVVVAQLRELGPLVTAIVVAGRSGAGLASELATMKVSEEIDALRSMGFDPVRWLVIPRAVALVIVMPLLTWIGDALALIGGFAATVAITDMTPRAYIVATGREITLAHLAVGLVKTPFLALAIGLIACGQGLAAQGGAAAVGARTTRAVVLAILGVIVTNALFTLFFTLLGI